MSLNDDDTLPQSYKYSWSANSEIPLQDFLPKFKPSMVQNDGTKPWIWVKGSEPAREDTGKNEEAIKEASKLLEEVTEKVESIKNDDSIPIRSNKKTGAKSKKELREQVQNEATEKLKEISVKHGYVGGKWLIFASPEKVDQIWTSLATSLVSGPLHKTSAYLAKVSTSTDENPNAQHLICVYIPDVYDKANVTEVMKVLLRNHGATLSGVKSDLYTVIGLDSKHSSGIPSTVWKNAAILPDKESKELKDAFFAELTSNKTAQVDAKATEPAATKTVEGENADVAPAATKAKSKPKPKLKKKAQDDFFASDDEASEDKTSTSKTTGTKHTQADEDDDEEEQPKKKKSVRK
ncbi:translation initiation factor eIF 4e-like domain-containing protein [Gymnopilus junonius]|uniref:Translation initiation factor eIF 4e-like domain-containing protein n=1 Tax=Gymnopilus junonius TaxID=109634 RepID=A0A9P5P0C0_GYMJU|nr:translation initiation factor eIF 4e-like domain-containing protein [Gymnopilus junonius]